MLDRAGGRGLHWSRVVVVRVANEALPILTMGRARPDRSQALPSRSCSEVTDRRGENSCCSGGKFVLNFLHCYQCQRSTDLPTTAANPKTDPKQESRSMTERPDGSGPLELTGKVRQTFN